MKPSAKLVMVAVAVVSLVVLYFVLQSPPNVGDVSDASALLGH